MKRPIRILLQTTIPATEDDWHIGRFSLLGEHLSGLRDGEGHALCEVTARNRETNADGDDEVLNRLDATDFDELWLFAVDTGDGVVLLTDMFGGTPSNLAISVMDRPKVEVIAGINLPMLIKLASLRSTETGLLAVFTEHAPDF